MFKFEPIIQTKLWGGSKIARLKGISDRNDIGESWEISGVEGFETVVAEGPYRGMPLNRLVATLKEQLVGRSVYQRHGNQFPLLFKFIDASDDLSIQVHPDDEAARRNGLQSGKTEMWYVLPSAPGARLYNGLAVQTDAEGLRRMVADKTIMQALAQYEISEGDVFFIPAGRIHAIGAGCMVAEIQQTSDTTYRLYDYDRRDRDGHLRPLHIEQAADCTDYNVLPDYRTHYQPTVNKPTEVISCPYFTTSVLPVNGTAAVDCSTTDSFVVVMAVSGQGTLTADGSDGTFIQAGQTVLLPATTQRLEAAGTMKLLLTKCQEL